MIVADKYGQFCGLRTCLPSRLPIYHHLHICDLLIILQKD